jgi:U6 snRNA-associated Sm-like protein LSm6
MENGTTTQGEGRDPSGFLSEIIGSQVTVKLNSGVVYKGMVSFTNTGILLIECL